jgi:iron complex transport system ATP-binding protein
VVNLLDAKGLHYTWPAGVHAVQGVDFQLGPGELVVVCGPNGSGKSTLLRLLGGLLTPDGGALSVCGAALASLSLADRARTIARVPQRLRTLPDVSVEHFALAGRYARIDRWRGPQEADHSAVSSALVATDVDELGERSMSALSGGQRQRVLLARAFASEARVLLVDEPTNGLDPGHQVHVLQLIREHAQDERGAVVVTHDLNLASQFATSVVLMNEGRVVDRGSPFEVMRPEVLRPVYGEHLHYGAMPPPDGRPFVVPWLDPPADRGRRG